ncbi:MAG TPA: hypothetical protein VF742_00330, partial [Terracidiphilus sp.]
VSHDMVETEIFYQHQHVEGNGHGVKRAAVVPTGIVPPPRAQLRLHVDDLIGTPPREFPRPEAAARC